MNTQLNSNKGFTLIEVILVLAIAALIFLMIFVALPALQASQRDTARKNDASIVAAAVTKYTSGERKAFDGNDTAARADLLKYIDRLDQYDQTDHDSDPATPDTWVDVFVFDDSNMSLPTALDKTKIYVSSNMVCDGSEATVTGATSRDTAVVVILDNEQTTYCVDAS